MNHSDYKAADDAALETLIRFKVSKLPVRMSDGIKQMGIPLVPYSKSEAFLTEVGLGDLLRETDGFSVQMQGKYYIFYRDDMIPGRIRFTVAHELGHIILGHLERETQAARNCGFQRDNAPNEQMANLFASRLLAPDCVLLALNVSSPYCISKLCNISLKAARIRAKQLNQLKKRGAPGMSPLEREVHKQFQDFILFHQARESAPEGFSTRC